MRNIKLTSKVEDYDPTTEIGRVIARVIKRDITLVVLAGFNQPSRIEQALADRYDELPVQRAMRQLIEDCDAEITRGRVKLNEWNCDPIRKGYLRKTIRELQAHNIEFEQSA